MRRRVKVSVTAYHAPSHAVPPVLMVKPLRQLSHMAVPCLVQAAPTLGEPFGQLHMTLVVVAVLGVLVPEM